MAFMLHLWILMNIGLVTFNMQSVFGAPQVPFYFSFGDSLVDNGNNNNLSTRAKANYPPYGIDFHKGPTGRFTNGRNIADFVAQLLGFTNFLPPSEIARGQDILKGVNYGSGGAGICDETSTHLTLYNYGARKIALFGAPAIGCMPAEINTAGSTACVDSINAEVELFNNRIKPLVDKLNAKLVGSKFIYLNTSSIQPRDRTNNGIQIFNQPCCQVAPALCAPGSVPCSDRTKYAYYDLVHPTEIVYAEVSKRAYASELPTDAYPTDICHLAQQ